MTRHLIGSGSTFEQEIGYSRAVVVGDWVFVSGTTGFDYSHMTIAEGLLEQTEQCLKNIDSALQQVGSSMADVVRVTYVLPNGAEFPECWPALRKYFGDVRPAAMMISAGLADPRMRIEIEVTALKQSAGLEPPAHAGRRIDQEVIMQSDEEQIRQLVATWIAATEAGDVDTILGLMAEDVVFLVPGGVPMYKSEFAAAARAQASHAAPTFDGTSDIQEIKVIGDWAFMWTKLAVIATPPDGSPRTHRAAIR